MLARGFLRLAPATCDWFIGLPATVAIGQGDYFGFGLRHSSENHCGFTKDTSTSIGLHKNCLKRTRKRCKSLVLAFSSYSIKLVSLHGKNKILILIAYKKYKGIRTTKTSNATKENTIKEFIKINMFRSLSFF